MIHIPSRKADDRQGPLVTYVISTYNRPAYLKTCLESALAQEYRNLQVLVVRDGGAPVREVIESFDDDRLEFIDRDENRGLCYSYNQAMQYIRGKYVAYLGDDDVHYPQHIRRHVEALEGPTDCLLSYSDLYCVLVNVLPGGHREILAKSNVVSRDFDRTFEMEYNSAPGGATVHRTDLFERTGPYNEEINVLIDWDMARRMSFFTDFIHLPEVTGEFFTQVNQKRSDRISDVGRKDRGDFSDRCRKIIWSRPPKPWPKMKDTSIVYLMKEVEPRSLSVVGSILSRTSYPYLIYLPLPPSQSCKLDLDHPNVRLVEVEEKASNEQRLDAALAACEGDFVAIVPDSYPIAQAMWIEGQIHALTHNDSPRMGYLLSGSANRRAALVRKEELAAARQRFAKKSVWGSLQAAKIELRPLEQREMPMLRDGLIELAERDAREDRWERGARRYADIPGSEGDYRVTQTRAAWCYYMAGDCNEKALELTRLLRGEQDCVDLQLLEADLLRRDGNHEAAACLYKQALKALEPFEVQRAAETV